MEISEIIPHIEALIFASDKALNANDITELINNAFGFLEERITLDQVESALNGIQEKYATEFYPFELKQSGGGWQFLTKPTFHSTIAQLNGDKFLKRLSNAALESLAIIAYKQPITKGEVEAIRGVNSDYSIQKLLEKELIAISGRNELLPGNHWFTQHQKHLWIILVSTQLRTCQKLRKCWPIKLWKLLLLSLRTSLIIMFTNKFQRRLTRCVPRKKRRICLKKTRPRLMLKET